MGNFYRDNEDIQFLFRYINLRELATLREDGFKFAGQFDYAPANANEAVQNYDMVLHELGQLAADFIAPRAEEIDRQGNTLNQDGTVSYATGISQSLEKLAQAEVMGFTLPYRFGGLNFPNLIYTMAIEIISRADASLMNLFGLQGIAETINAFASEEIKQKYLPKFASGKVTGAMALTEPDAGSDLQSVKLQAFQDEKGNWFLHGVKRFITNGCGDVLLVLARSEPDRAGGLGLSLFVCEKSKKVYIRRLEDKLGIHGSPTCEIFFDNTPCQLIGERGRGLATYVMSLMNGARIAVAAQSVGIAEAAFRIARQYAATRKQFGVPIEKLPAVADMLIDMKIAIEASRALLYETSRIVSMLDTQTTNQKSQITKDQWRKYKRYAAMLTPMSKYYCSEMCNRVTYDSIQVLGGSGYMQDYACERHARDGRVTTIYEGTSQLQIVAAVRGIASGTAERFIAQLAQQNYNPELKDSLEKLAQGTEQLKKAVAFIKQQGRVPALQGPTEYMDLYGRALVDIAIDLIIGYLLCSQASTKKLTPETVLSTEKELKLNSVDSANSAVRENMKKHKAMVARRYITRNMPKLTTLAELICTGDKSTFTDYNTLVGPVMPEA